MARPRVIDREDVLDAAETVVGRDGAARMTLDAVATEAGISKASVIYDYKSKQSLIRAVVERRIRVEEDKIRVSVDAMGSKANAAVLGRVYAATDSFDDETRAVALSLCSALAQDAELRDRMQDFYRDQLGSVLEACDRPREARLAFLALEGLKMLECFDFLILPKEEREHILRDIASLVDDDFSSAEACCT